MPFAFGPAHRSAFGELSSIEDTSIGVRESPGTVAVDLPQNEVAIPGANRADGSTSSTD